MRVKGLSFMSLESQKCKELHLSVAYAKESMARRYMVV